MAKITKYHSIAFKKSGKLRIKKGIIDNSIKCQQCAKKVFSSKPIQTPQGILLRYVCECGLITNRIYNRAPDFNHQDCAEVL